MKRKILFIIVLFILTIYPVYANDDLIKNAKAGILMEESTGEILFEKNSNEKMSVASMTKMVAQILVLENIENNKLKWDDKVVASSNASSMGGSQIYLQTGEVMSVYDLMKGVSLASANDAVVALAEKIAGTESEFVKLMNNKVKELGLKNTNFVNCTGLDENNHYSTAYDMAIIAKELLKHKKILEFSSIYEDYLRENTSNKFWLVNTNKLVRFYNGADGLKTGFTDLAKYCIAATAKRDNMRLIAIVLGEDNGTVRNNETMNLLDYGFNSYRLDLIKNKNNMIDSVKLENTNISNLKIYPKEDISILNKKSDPNINYEIEIKLNELNYPINSNSVVGKIIIKNGNKVVKEIDAITKEKIVKLSFIELYFNSLKKMIFNR